MKRASTFQGENKNQTKIQRMSELYSEQGPTVDIGKLEDPEELSSLSFQWTESSKELERNDDVLTISANFGSQTSIVESDEDTNILRSSYRMKKRRSHSTSKIRGI